MNEEVQIGDVVVLKSGGPWMIIDDVNRVGGKDKFLCKWFDEMKCRFNVDYFSNIALFKVKEEQIQLHYQDQCIFYDEE